MSGSAVSEIIFIIYLAGVMEDLAAMNRRSDLPAILIKDRPHGQARNLSRGHNSRIRPGRGTR